MSAMFMSSYEQETNKESSLLTKPIIDRAIPTEPSFHPSATRYIPCTKVEETYNIHFMRMVNIHFMSMVCEYG